MTAASPAREFAKPLSGLADAAAAGPCSFVLALFVVPAVSFPSSGLVKQVKGWRPLSRGRCFSITFKALSCERQALPGRIATLSQHLHFIRVSF
jgi:hypothetical protein